MLQIVDEPVDVGRLCGCGASALLEMFFQFLLGELVPSFEVPVVLHGSRVVTMLHVATPLENEGLQSFFAQFLGGPAAANPGAYDDGVVGVGFGSFTE